MAEQVALQGSETYKLAFDEKSKKIAAITALSLFILSATVQEGGVRLLASKIELEKRTYQRLTDANDGNAYILTDAILNEEAKNRNAIFEWSHRLKPNNLKVDERMLFSLCYLNSLDYIYGFKVDEEQLYSRLVHGFAISALKRARQAQKDNAISYRNFNVGAARVAYNPDNSRLGIFTGFNAKVDGTDLINIHAEEVVVGKIRRFGGSIITLLAVVGDLQPDQQSGTVTTTLHPCGRCRKMLAETGLVTDRTVFMSATIDLQNVEIYDLPALVRLHDEGVDGTFDRVKLPEFPVDTPGETEWDEVWDSQVSLAFLKRIHNNSSF